MVGGEQEEGGCHHSAGMLRVVVYPALACWLRLYRAHYCSLGELPLYVLEESFCHQD